MMWLLIRLPTPLQVIFSVALAIAVHCLVALALFGPFDLGTSRAELIVLPPSIGVQLVPPPPAIRAQIWQPPSAADSADSAPAPPLDKSKTPDAPLPDASSSPSTTTSVSDTPRAQVTASSLVPSLLDELVAEQEAELQLQSDLEQVKSHVSVMIYHIGNYWSRPLSARSGMTARVRIRMIPSGELVGVSLLETSGDDAFDRSAIQAIEQASPLPVPTDTALFEGYFRSMQLVFNPEDL